MDCLKDGIPTQVANGKKYISIPLAEKLAEMLDVTKDKALHESLSDREYDVMCMIAAGKTLTEISEKLNLSVKTVSTYKSRILDKMEFKSSADIIRYAIKNNLSNLFD